MAWFAVDLDDTLVRKEMDEETGQEVTVPVMGAAEAMMQLAGEGHRLTVFTSRFAPMPATARENMKQKITAELAGLGFPEMEIWTGTTKPDADLFIGDKYVTFDGDWSMTLAQTQVMLEERGLVEIAPDDGLMPDENIDPNYVSPQELQ